MLYEVITFAGVGDATHGQHNRLRAPGSVGASSYPSRVFKGMRMAGRTGGDRVKVESVITSYSIHYTKLYEASAASINDTTPTRSSSPSASSTSVPFS